MTKYREIIRLKSLNFSERNIALSCSVSRNTVSKICKKAEEQNLTWPLDESMTDAVLEKLLLMILATSGQRSYNTRTNIPTTSGQAFLHYSDKYS